MKVEITRQNGEKDVFEVSRVQNDYYGNPRYVIHFLSLGLKDYVATKQTRAAGLKLYRAKCYGGGFVFQSYNLTSSIQFMFEKIHNEKIKAREV